MKYYVVSLTGHILILLAFSWNWSMKNQPPTKAPKSPVVVDLVMAPPTAQTKPVMVKKRIPKPKLAKKNKRVKKAPKEKVEEFVLETAPTKPVKVRYSHQLQAYIEQNKFYPRAAIRLRQSGVVKIRLIIQPNGNFRTVEIMNPSPFTTINKAAVKLVSGLKSFKPLPKSYTNEEEFIIPIVYQLKGKTL